MSTNTAPAVPEPNSFDPTTTALSSSDPCPFCKISDAYAAYPPSSPPPPSSPSLSPSLVNPRAYIVLSTSSLIAFLDIQPLSRGHVLLCPRAHRPRLTDATPGEAADLGARLRVLSAAVARATQTPDWNVVQNNGAAAAQVVGHVHYHVVPRPGLRAADAAGRRSFTMFGRGVREDLDEEDAAVLAAEVRRRVAEVVREEEEEEEEEEEKEEKEKEEGEEKKKGREGLKGKL
ncbi:HIT-like domain-containing protein [Biscogniauxia mediterranea]|nr:HIT-like domain-containing protein [Biscogniauxia mediterranea]